MNKPTFKDKQRTMFARQKSLRENATPAELEMKKVLDELGVRYFFQKCFIAGDFYCIADFYIPKPYKIVLEIDGEYHNTKEQQYKDKYRDKFLLENRGVRTIRLTNRQVFEKDIKDFVLIFFED